MRRSSTERPAAVRRRRRWLAGCARASIAATLAAGLVGLLGNGTAAAESAHFGAGLHARAAKKHNHPLPPYTNKIDPPPTPPEVVFDSGLAGNPAPLLGNTQGDTESWNGLLGTAPAIAPGPPILLPSGQDQPPLVPLDGWLIGVTMKGRAVSGDMPGPAGSQPFRIGVEVLLPNGNLQVKSTSDPPFQLPGTLGTYYFPIGPPSTGFPMRLQKGQVVSFDNRGGTFAVYANVPGSTTYDTVGMGLQQDAGAIWTGTPHTNIELLMQVTELPSLPTTYLDRASAAIGEAQTLEQGVQTASRSKAKRALLQSAELLESAENAVQQAAVGAAPGQLVNLPEISASTAASLKHYLDLARAEDRKAPGKKLTREERTAHIKAAIEAKRTALSDIRKARGMAKQVP